MQYFTGAHWIDREALHRGSRRGVTGGDAPRHRQASVGAIRTACVAVRCVVVVGVVGAPQAGSFRNLGVGGDVLTKAARFLHRACRVPVAP